MIFHSGSVTETQKHAIQTAKKEKKAPTLILLNGPLGAGKTEWARAFIKSYLGKDEVVTSPSYSIVNGYKKGSRQIYHVDLYRLNSVDDLESVGFWDLLSGKNIILVEWGNRLPLQWPQGLNVLEVDFKILSDSERQINISRPV